MKNCKHHWLASLYDPPSCQKCGFKPLAEIERLCHLLKLVQSDPGNWLHTDLEEAIEAAVGPPQPYRDIDDSGLEASVR